jgi:hypothetical protein
MDGAGGGENVKFFFNSGAMLGIFSIYFCTFSFNTVQYIHYSSSSRFPAGCSS